MYTVLHKSLKASTPFRTCFRPTLASLLASLFAHFRMHLHIVVQKWWVNNVDCVKSYSHISTSLAYTE